MTGKDTAGSRVAELDAVRGLAAIVVVLGHLMITLPAMDGASRANGLTAINLIRFSPLDGLLEGSAAVIVFFVLSGYVLALSFGRGRQTYGGFMVRRFARLWFPYAAAIAAAIVLVSLFGGEVVGLAGNWFNRSWQGGVGLGSVLEHFSLVGHIQDDYNFDPVIWSLVVEMRISIFFPLLLVVLAAFGWRLAVLGGIVVCVLGVALSKHVLIDFKTLDYVICFLVGAALAQNHGEVSRFMRMSTRTHRRLMLLIAILLFTYADWMPPDLLPGPLGGVARTQVTVLLANTAAATIFIVLARFPGRARAFLLSAVPQYFGRVSYSLYLLHAVVILTVIHIIDPGNTGLILALFAPMLLASIILADFAQRLIEAPSQRLGRRMARRLEGDTSKRLESGPGPRPASVGGPAGQ